MAITNIFNEQDFPKIIYKYRSWNKDFHKRILINQELYYAEPNSFTDDYDCKLSFDYNSFSDEEIYNYFLNDSKRKYPNKSNLEHRQYASYWFNNTSIRELNHRQSVINEYREKFSNECGVLSMTYDCENKRMWRDYANDYRGVCFGFDTRILMQYSDRFGGIGYVEYYENLPKLLRSDLYADRGEKNVFSKQLEYSFEKEIRLYKAKNENIKWRTPQFPFEALKVIIFGPHMKKKHKEEIKRIAKIYPNIILAYAIFDKGCIKVY